MKKPNLIRIVFVPVVFLFSLSCIFFQTLVQSRSVALHTPEQLGAIIIQEDFSDESIWASKSFRQGAVGYKDGGYHIFLYSIGSLHSSHSYQYDQLDYQIEVDARKIGGGDSYELGLVCRVQNPNSFYSATINNDGSYSLRKHANGVYYELNNRFFLPRERVTLNEDINHFRLDCVDNRLSFYVNGIFVTSVTDSTYSIGLGGVFAGSLDEGGVDILFDNFIIHGRP